jgi:NAD-dependent DNA ligase
MEQIVTKLGSKPLSKLQKYLDKADLEDLHQAKLYLDDLYYNAGDSPLDDARYDMLKDTLTRRDPNYIPPVGAKIRTHENRVKLPFWLGSADKITPDEPEVLERWVRDNPTRDYVASDKLDGVSCLMESKGGKIKLYTRGDGIIGADISFLAQYFKTIPKNLTQDITVRGELIIKKRTFEKYRRIDGQRIDANGNKTYRNARNMVAGLLGGKTIRRGMKDVDFVVYEIVGDSMPKPSVQLRKLKKLGFAVVRHERITNVSMQNLAELYTQFKDESLYDIDGLMIQANQPYDRNVSGNPDYIFAFKMMMGDALHETTVQKVEWNVSKWGQLKPVVIVDPVQLSDITISRVTAHNAKYVEEQKLGPGAVIQVTRSKEVIPYIVSVVTPADEPQMPTVPYKWDKTHVNISVTKHQDTICIKLVSSFFAKLGIKHVSDATVKKMFANGLNNLLKIVAASERRLLQVPEFQKSSAKRIHTNIRNGLKNVKLSLVLGASGVFGFGLGRKRMDALLLDIPNLLTVYRKKSREQMLNMVLDVEGFSDIMAEKVVANLKWADLFIKKLSKYATFKEEVRVSDSMKGKKYVMTGFRDKKLEEDIGERGGKTTSSVSRNTTALIVASKGGKLTGKLKKASDLGVPIYEKAEFITKFIT